MDAETEVAENERQEVKCSDTDEGLDKLLRKAVTVSQVNLPIATIDRDIDDIASSYSEESERPDNVLDEEFLRLIERTRQRRELLNQKMGKTPEAAPRKRRTPLSEDLTDNVGDELKQQKSDDSPKRQCVRESEQMIKPDTPAIPSVQSRLQDLASQHAQWSEAGAGDGKESTPVPTPRKSLSSPPLERARPADSQENSQPTSLRKSRFAQLARSINDWEDDLSHPTIVKEEEKKPRWQPPKATTTPAPEQVSSPKKSRAPLPPSSTAVSSAVGSKPSEQKTTVSASSVTKDFTKHSPIRSGSRVGFNSSPKPFQPYTERTARVSPVKSPASSRSNLSKGAEAPKESKVPQQGGQVTMRGAGTPSSAVKPPSERPLSARLANWEQKISESSKPDVPATPKTGQAASTAVSCTPKQVCTPAQPISTPSQGDNEAVQLRPKVRKSIDDEPTAHPVLARMSAWEQMSSAQVVSDIKKVRPGDCTPVKTPGPKAQTPGPKAQTPGPKTPAGKKSPEKAAATPGKSSLTPGKSFKDSILERASQMNPGTAAQAQGSASPGKSQGLSPKRASSAMKSVQQKLVQQTQSTDMAERLRQERMAELQAIQNRWKNGILKDDKEDVQPEEVPKADSVSKGSRRLNIREKARTDIEETETTAIPKVENMEIECAVDKTSENGPNKSDQTNGGTLGEEDVHVKVGKRKRSGLNMTADEATKDEESMAKRQSVQKEMMEQDLGSDHHQPGDHKVDAGGHEAEVVERSVGKAEPALIVPVKDGQALEVDREAGVVDDQVGPVGSEAGTADPKEGGSIEGPGESKPPGTGTNFENKLASMGFDMSDEGKASYSFNESQKAAQKTETPSSNTRMGPPAPPPLPSSSSCSSGSKVTGKQPRPNTLFNIVTQQKKEGATAADCPKAGAANATKVCRKVKFDDSFDSDDSNASLPKKKALQQSSEAKPVMGVTDNVSESDTTDDAPTEITEDDSDLEVVLRRPRPGAGGQRRPRSPDEDDDLSLSAFVSASVRRQSILPSPQQSGQAQTLDTSFGSLDSSEGAPDSRDVFHKSTVDLVRLGQQCAEMESSSSSLTSQSTTDSSSDLPGAQRRSGYCPEDTEDSVDDREAIGDLLEEAMDSESEEPSTSSASPVMMRKRPSHRKATEDGSLPFSIDEYRASRNMQVQEVKQRIVRNSQYVGMPVEEEHVEMPTQAPTPAPRQSVQERIRELQELVQQEQNVIMQTSNALNQCCSSSSYFAGSAEQVECNRILLISCQKRQAYMLEIQRLRDTRILDESGPGPKGSLTISDIRLPLKKEFVTKIGTSQDTTTYFFILLLRNGPQVICTQMLSTHDPMMRGSLDFPNLIKINGVTGSFKLQLEIYSMSVSREQIGKDKKKKTPKKLKGGGLAVQSPGGPTAVRTTSFSQVSCVQLTMKCLDKHSFNLERLSHLSPLHGTIYMNLRCLMEASVEERGFLTMFEDVSGLGSWHRRWCALSGNKLQFWKYPDDETRKDPMGYIDLKRCITEKVGLISRDICARPNTFELVSVRQPRKGEKDTLISRTYNTMTTIRHMLSADTKEERIVWCNKLNRALANIRTWHSDALRPISK